MTEPNDEIDAITPEELARIDERWNEIAHHLDHLVKLYHTHRETCPHEQPYCTDSLLDAHVSAVVDDEPAAELMFYAALAKIYELERRAAQDELERHLARGE